MLNGTVVVISGPSGCGKNTVYNALRARLPQLEQTVSATTRAPREGETEGVDYYFITPEEFDRWVAEDAFLEYVQYGENRYGTPRSEIPRLLGQGKIAVLIIEVTGAGNIKRSIPEAVTVFLAPPSLKTLEQRIRKRGDTSEEELRRRMKIAKKEMKHKSEYDHCVVNDDLETCVEQVSQIILAHERSQQS